MIWKVGLRKSSVSVRRGTPLNNSISGRCLLRTDSLEWREINTFPRGNHYLLSLHHPRHHSPHLLKTITRLCWQSLNLGRPRIRIDHMEHGISHFLIPSLFDRFPSLLSNLKLSVEAFDGHGRIHHWSLHGDPELVLLLAKLRGYSFQDF